MAAYIGISGLMISAIDVLPIPHPTKSTLPTGGVHKPILKFNTMIMPKCKGEIPKPSATGKNIGVKVNTAGVISINVPTTNNTKLMIINTKIGFSESVIIAWLINCGIPSKDNIQDIAADAAISNMTMEVVKTARKKISGKSLKLISRYMTKANNRE